MQALIGAIAGGLLVLSGLCLNEWFRSRKQAAQLPITEEERELERRAALEEQWNNIMRFDGTAQID